MKRIAIIGGGISGLAAAYELEKARKAGAEIDWQLYEASDRLGGIVQTTLRDSFVLEGGPDGWVTEKPWAAELCRELGLESQIISSNDATRKTYILVNGKLQPIPDGMRMMVPEDLGALENSPLFSASAKAAYAAELARATELRQAAPEADESVASFVQRHFGEEVLTTLAAPLLSGVFGGDVERLSVRAVMPAFVAMEREHGSLIAALQAKALARDKKSQQPIFTSLRNGVGSLVDAIVAKLPADRLHLNSPVFSLKREGKLWCVRHNTPAERGIPGKTKKHFRHVFLATPVDITRTLLESRDPAAAALLPSDASSAVLAAFTWPADLASQFTIPQGFGFLAPPPTTVSSRPEANLTTLSPRPEASLTALSSRPEAEGRSGETRSPGPPTLLAATFVDQKFPHRAPSGARILRAFFGGASAAVLTGQTDNEIACAALTQLREILGPMPEPAFTTIQRWPRSLPQYEVGHLERMAELAERITAIPDLTLLGNSYNGVGLPDLIRDGRAAARKLIHTPLF